MKWNGFRGVVVVLALLPALKVRAAEPEVNWRSDYARARQEAAEKGRPLLIEFFDTCAYSVKLDKGPFRDPAIVRLVNSHFIPLKVHGGQNAPLVECLKIQFYPTLVFASADGGVLGAQEGYIETQVLKETLDRVVAATGDTEGMLRRFADGVKAREAGDISRALALFKQLADESKGRPIQVRTLQQVQEVEQLARAQAQRGLDVANLPKPNAPIASSDDSELKTWIVELTKSAGFFQLDPTECPNATAWLHSIVRTVERQTTQPADTQKTPARSQRAERGEEVDALIRKLEAIRAQKADLDKREQEVRELLKERLKQQNQRLQKLGIQDGSLQPTTESPLPRKE